MKILYLGLKIFSVKGGIEQVNKNWLYALSEICKKKAIQFKAISLYDHNIDESYIQKLNFRACNKNVFLFGLKIIWNAFNTDILIVSHINLSLFALIAKLINPRLKIIAQLHGIEAWNNLSGVQERMLNLSYKLLAVSNFTKSTIQNKYPLLNEKLMVFNNSLDPITNYQYNKDLRNSTRDQFEVLATQKLLIMVGRLHKSEAYKGYDKTIEAIAQLKNENILFHIIGKYDKDEAQRICNLIEKHNLHSQVKLIGFVADDKLTQYYQAADLFVMPSMGEGFGLVFIDAMASGLRVVGGNIDGSIDAISPFDVSYLVNPNNLNEIANAIHQAIHVNWTSADAEKLSGKCNNLFSAKQFENRIEQLLF